jgi:DNA mismatch repair protein MutS2
LELNEVRRLLVAIESLVRFQKNRGQDTFPRLGQIVGSVSSLAGILAQINQALDESGQMKDSASTELQRLRRAIVEEQRALRKRLDSILRQALVDGHAPEGAEITIRGGRLVIPVVAEAKRKFRGFVHDESATGQTVYMEPTDVLDGNNRVRELEYEARREVQRILAQLTKGLHDNKESLEAGYEAVSLLDFIRAKARLALALGAIPAALNREGQLKLRQARNPLLEEVLGRQGRKREGRALRAQGGPVRARGFRDGGSGVDELNGWKSRWREPCPHRA